MNSSTPEPTHVLHIDDDTNFCNLTSTFLEREGENFTVETATNASDGLDYLTDAEVESGGIDCIVSDYDMPGMDGLSFLEAVREEHPDLPFILFTGKGDEEIASEAITAGVTDYLNKGSGTDQYTVLANRIKNAVSQYRTERELRRSNERLRKLYGGITDGIFVLNTDWEFIHLNELGEQLLQRSEADLIGENIWDQFPAATDTAFQEQYETAMNERVSVAFEEHYPPLDTWFEVRAVPTANGVTAHFRDITEKKESKQTIQTQNERLETIIGDAPVGLFVYDESGTFTFAKGRVLDQLDIESDDLVGSSIFDIYADRPRVVEDVRRAIEGETVHSNVNLYDRFFDVWFRPVENGEESSNRTIGVAIDVTDRKRIEQEVQPTENFLFELLENIPAGVLAEDSTRNVRFANDELCDMFDISAPSEALVGNDCAETAQLVKELFVDAERFVETNNRSVKNNVRSVRKEFDLVDGRTFERSGTPVAVTDDESGYLWVYHDITERKHNEEQLEALHEGTREMMNAETPEQVYQQAVATAHDALDLPLTGIWSYDPEEECLEPTAFTDEAHSLFDEFPTYTAGDSLSWEVFTTGEPAVYDDIPTQFSASDPDSPITSEIVVPLGDYGILNSGSTDSAVFDTSDIVTAQVLAANTEAALERAEREALLREREAELERERDNLAALFENVPFPVYRNHRENGHIVPEKINPAFEDVFGYDEEQIVGRPVTETIIPDDGTRKYESLASASDGGHTVNAEIERLTATGRRTFLLHNAPITESGKGQATDYSIYTDITERRENESFRRRLYDITADTELVTTETIEKVLELGCEYLEMESGFLTHIEGDTQQIVRASSPHEALQPGKEYPLLGASQKTIEMDEPLTIEHAQASGWESDPAYERFGFEAYVGVKLMVDGERYGTVCFADRTPRETGLSEFERSFVDLTVRGIESTLERHKHETELERQNDQLEEFASVISHDLRNPLTVADGYLELASETGDDEYFTKAENAHDRMDAIIEDVLTLTRQGERIAETNCVDLSTVAENAWENVATADAELMIAADIGEIDADEGRLTQLFENLYRNAIEHAGENITVHVGRYSTEFYVEDDGSGIPESEREKVFNSGYTTGDEGTGMGLSIVETIAAAHGWEIEVEEGIEGGARFNVQSGMIKGDPDNLLFSD